jgi:hypothetical protein
MSRQLPSNAFERWLRAPNRAEATLVVCLVALFMLMDTGRSWFIAVPALLALGLVMFLLRRHRDGASGST